MTLTRESLSKIKDEYQSDIRNIQSQIIKYYEMSWYNRMVINADLTHRKIRIIELKSKIVLLDELMESIK